MENSVEHYAAKLELSANHLSSEIIHKSYRRLALKYHPDKNPAPEANARFIDIRQAYTFLMTKLSPLRMLDQKNPPIVINIAVSLSQIIHGSTFRKTISRFSVTSPGKRKRKEYKTFEIHISRGTFAGTSFKFANEGHQLFPGSARGDVVFCVEDKPHPIFKRVNQTNLEYTANISQKKFISGGVVLIPTLENELEWKQINADLIKRGSLCISGKGLPLMTDPTKRGDLIVHFKVNVDWIKVERTVYNVFQKLFSLK